MRWRGWRNAAPFSFLMPRATNFTYSGDPSASDKDAVRYLVGDTDEDDPLQSDEEIQYLLEIEGGVYRAAIGSCKAIAALLSRRPDYKAGRITVSNRQRAQDFLDLAEKLRMRFVNSSAIPFAGGVSVLDKESRTANTDLVRPFFTRNSFVPPGEPNRSPVDIDD